MNQKYFKFLIGTVLLIFSQKGQKHDRKFQFLIGTVLPDNCKLTDSILKEDWFQFLIGTVLHLIELTASLFFSRIVSIPYRYGITEMSWSRGNQKILEVSIPYRYGITPFIPKGFDEDDCFNSL